MSDMEVLVARHDVAIENMVESIDRLTSAVEKTDTKMDKVVEALSQNAVILEKIANIDSSNKDSVNRLHKRIDDLINTVDAKEIAFNNQVNKIATDATKGGKIYDIALYTAKAIAWVIPIFTALMAGLFYLIEHGGK